MKHNTNKTTQDYLRTEKALPLFLLKCHGLLDKSLLIHHKKKKKKFVRGKKREPAVNFVY